MAELALSQQTSLQRGSEISLAGPCANCQVRHLNICRVLLNESHGRPPPQNSAVDWQVYRRVRARHNICTAGDPLNLVYVICEGWAFRFVQLPDGRRQVLSVVLPGDVFTATAIFKAKRRTSVQAITDVHLCGYPRDRLKESLVADPELFSAWTDLLADETLETNHLLVDLGCRSAEERIAHLILSLRKRMKRRGVAIDASIPFPLRQRLIAAITGLTPEHVNRVMRSFREAGMIETGKKSVTILNLAEFRRIGELRA